MALVSVCTFYLNKPTEQSIVKSTMFPQLILAGAVVVCSVALLLSDSGSSSSSGDSGSSKDSYVPHVYPSQPQMHHQPHYQQPPPQRADENFIMRDGLPKKDGKPLGQRLKEAGWEVVIADWCGFCTRQMALFDDHPEEQMNLIIVKEDEMTPAQKELNEGFPAWMNCTTQQKSPGFKPTFEQIAALLEK